MQASAPFLSARSQTVVKAVLLLLALVALSHLADALLVAVPVATGEVRWRFQVFGAFLSVLPQLALLLASIAGLGAITSDRISVRTASVIALLLGVVAVCLLPVFGLDFIEMRRQVPMDRKTSFDLGTLKIGFFGGCFFLVLVNLGWRGLKATAKDRQAQRKEGQGLVVGQG